MITRSSRRRVWPRFLTHSLCDWKARVAREVDRVDEVDEVGRGPHGRAISEASTASQKTTTALPDESAAAGRCRGPPLLAQFKGHASAFQDGGSGEDAEPGSLGGDPI
jgi:hypothetical protein